MGGMNWEIGINIDTLLCIKLMTNENLLYSTGNSTQCCGDPSGKEIQKRGEICMYTYGQFTLLYSRN